MRGTILITPARWLAALGLAALLPVRAGAITIVAGSVTVSRSVDSGATWTTVTPAACTDVFTDDWIAVTMTLVNDSGLLGNMVADTSIPTPPPPTPTMLNLDPCNFLWENNGADTSRDPLAETGCPVAPVNAPGTWPGQYWMWPLQGPCTGPLCPGPYCGCPNDIFPLRGNSPVELVTADDVLGFNYNAQYLTRMERYDPGGGTWAPMAPMNVAGTPAPRGWHGMAQVGGKLYVAGGRDANGPLDTMLIYDPGSDTWTQAKGTMSSPRDRVAVVAVPGVPDKIFVIGGRDAGGAPSAVVDVYDTVLQTWDSASWSLGTARFGLAAAYAPTTGLIYVFGGFDGTDATDVIESLDPLAPGPAAGTGTTLSVARFGLGAAWSPFDSMIYLVGGYIGGIHASVGTLDVFDPAGPSCSAVGVDIYPDEADAAVAELNNQVFAVGGFADSAYCGPNGSAPASLGVSPAGASFLPGSPQAYDPSGFFWAPLTDLPFARSRAAAASDGTYLYVSGGFGLKYKNAATVTSFGGVTDTCRVSWIFQAKTEWPQLDFKVMAADQDDGEFGCAGGSIEGSGLDCNTPPGCEANVSTPPTLTAILQNEFGGNICIKPPFTSTSFVTVADPGGRPTDTAFVGDTLIVHTSYTNAGTAKTVNAGEACNTPVVTGSFCLTSLQGIGACSGFPQPYEVGTPAVPFAVPSGAVGEAVWTFSANGAGCSPLACGGSGTVRFQVAFKGGVSQTQPGFTIIPAPLAITATLWVDPDGSGTVFNAIPLGETSPGVAGPFYYMGRESLQAVFTYQNTSTSYAVDVLPAVNQSWPGDLVQLSGPVPAGKLVLGPGMSATVGWTFAKSTAATAYFESCNPVNQSLAITSAARGVCHAINVDMHPTPFEPFDICSGACAPFPAPTAHALTYNAPGNANLGSPYLVTLSARNADSRPFVLEAPLGALYMSLTTLGSASWSLGPPPVLGSSTWQGGEVRTFSWQVTPLSPGSVNTRAGIDFGAVSPPCLVACSDAVPYCSSLVRTTTYVIPGRLSLPSVRVSASPQCATNPVMVEWDIHNLSATDYFTATQYCFSGMPEELPNAGFNPAAVSPNPAPPVLTIPPLATMTVTFWMAAACTPSPPNAVGCFSAGAHWVEGYFNDPSGNLTNCCDFADYGGLVPGITITQPANLANGNIGMAGAVYNATLWTDAAEYSVGQKVRLYLSISNAGGDDLIDFQIGIQQNILTQNPQLVPSAGSWPVPPIPWTFTGNATCASPPPSPYKASGIFEWDFDVVQAPNTVAVGTLYFTATAGGLDTGCGSRVATTPDVLSKSIRIANSAQLVCKATATPLVTMAVACATCTPMSTCDQQTGEGCIKVEMVSSNFGDVAIRNARPSLGGGTVLTATVTGLEFPTFIMACDPSQCSTAFAVLRSQPPEAVTPGAIPPVTSVTYGWTYSPTGLGCVRIHTWLQGQDNATGASLFCDEYTNCVEVLPRFPLELTLVGAPARVAPGQAFNVTVRVCNPGGTPAGLQGGEPALQFYAAGTGGKVTEQYDVAPPPPAILASGECRDIQVAVTAHKNADPGAVEIRVPQGDRFIARDAATGLPFPSVDRGGPLTLQVMDLKNLLMVSGSNPAHFGPTGGTTVLTYQIADAGASGHASTRLKIYSLSGELVRTLVDKPAEVERADVAWDGRNASGQVVASGVYLVRLEGPNFSAVKKLAVVK